LQGLRVARHPICNGTRVKPAGRRREINENVAVVSSGKSEFARNAAAARDFEIQATNSRDVIGKSLTA
jgi:hypothetical protein